MKRTKNAPITSSKLHLQTKGDTNTWKDKNKNIHKKQTNKISLTRLLNWLHAHIQQSFLQKEFAI